MSDLQTRRTEIEGKIGELRQARACALLDGVSYDDGEIDRLQNLLAGLSDAEGEQTRRDRGEVEKLRLARIERLREQARDTEALRLEAIARAETAARELAKAIGEALSYTADLAKDVHTITSERVPIVVNPMNAESRLAGRLAVVMGTVPGRRYRLGGLVWGSSPYRAETSWHDDEAALVARHIDPILNPPKSKGKLNGTTRHEKD